MYLAKTAINLPMPPISEFDGAQLEFMKNDPKGFTNSYQFLNTVIVFMVKNNSERIRISNKRSIFIYDHNGEEIWIESNSNRRGFRFRLIEPEPVILDDELFNLATQLDRYVVQEQKRTVLEAS